MRDSLRLLKFRQLFKYLCRTHEKTIDNNLIKDFERTKTLIKLRQYSKHIYANDNK